MQTLLQIMALKTVFSKFQTFAKIFTFLLPLVCSKSPSNVLTTPCNFMSEKRRKVLRGQVKSKTDKNIEKEGTLYEPGGF